MTEVLEAVANFVREGVAIGFGVVLANIAIGLFAKLRSDRQRSKGLAQLKELEAVFEQAFRKQAEASDEKSDTASTTDAS